MDSFEGWAEDSLSLHKYAYCHLNPLNGIDPSGHFFTGVGAVSVSAISAFGRNSRAIAAYNVYDKVETMKEAVTVVQQLAATGTVNPIALAALMVDFTPFGKVLKKAKFATSSSRLLTGSEDFLRGVYKRAGESTKSAAKLIGEVGAGLAAKAKGYQKIGDFHPSYHGIDDIFFDPKTRGYIIMEAKGGVAQLASGQMSKNWIKSRIDRLKNKGMNDLAAILENQWQNGSLKAAVVRTKTTGPNAFKPDIELKDWNSIGLDSWTQ